MDDLMRDLVESQIVDVASRTTAEYDMDADPELFHRILKLRLEEALPGMSVDLQVEYEEDTGTECDR